MKTRVFILAFALSVLGAVSAGQPSRGGSFQATGEVLGNARTAPEWNIWRAVVTAADGSRRYVVEKRIPFDVPPPAIFVSDAGGAAVVVASFDGFVEFYDGSGNLRQMWRPFGSAAPDYERVIRCSVAGEKVAFLVGEREGGDAQVVMADMDGRRLWGKSLGPRRAGAIVLADSGDVILACTYEVRTSLVASTTILTAGGTELRQLPLYVTCADIASDGTRFAIAARREVTVGLTASPGADRTWPAADPGQAITAVCLTGGGVVVAAETYRVGRGGPEFTDLRITLYGDDGTMRQTKTPGGSTPMPARLGRRGTGVELTTSGSPLRLEMAPRK